MRDNKFPGTSNALFYVQMLLIAGAFTLSGARLFAAAWVSMAAACVVFIIAVIAGQQQEEEE